MVSPPATTGFSFRPGFGSKTDLNCFAVVPRDLPGYSPSQPGKSRYSDRKHSIRCPWFFPFQAFESILGMLMSSWKIFFLLVPLLLAVFFRVAEPAHSTSTFFFGNPGIAHSHFRGHADVLDCVLKAAKIRRRQDDMAMHSFVQVSSTSPLRCIDSGSQFVGHDMPFPTSMRTDPSVRPPSCC